MTQELQTTLDAEIDVLLPTLKKDQLDYVINNGKYLQVILTESGGLSYEVHEKVAPTGIGFSCIFYASEDSKDYRKLIGFGVEKNDSKWTEIIEEDLI